MAQGLRARGVSTAYISWIWRARSVRSGEPAFAAAPALATCRIDVRRTRLDDLASTVAEAARRRNLRRFRSRLIRRCLQLICALNNRRKRFPFRLAGRYSTRAP